MRAIPIRMAITALAAIGCANTSAATTLLQCGRLVDVRSLEVLTERTIVVDDKKIVRVDKGFTGGPNALVVNLRDHTCLPGLIDLHVHLAFSLSPASTVENFTFNPADYAVRSVGNAEKTLMAGFTSVRDLGSAQGVSVALRNAINRGLVKGPRIQTAGFITSTGGHGDPTNALRADLMGNPGPDLGIVSGADEARRAVRQRYKEGFDLIKISTTGGVLSKKGPRFLRLII